MSGICVRAVYRSDQEHGIAREPGGEHLFLLPYRLAARGPYSHAIREDTLREIWQHYSRVVVRSVDRTLPGHGFKKLSRLLARTGGICCNTPQSAQERPATLLAEKFASKCGCLE